MFGRMDDPIDDIDDDEHETSTHTITRHRKTGRIVKNTKQAPVPPKGKPGRTNANPRTVAAERKGPRVPSNPSLPAPRAAKPGGTAPAKKAAFKGGTSSGAVKKDGIAALKARLTGRMKS